MDLLCNQKSTKTFAIPCQNLSESRLSFDYKHEKELFNKILPGESMATKLAIETFEQPMNGQSHQPYMLIDCQIGKNGKQQLCLIDNSNRSSKYKYDFATLSLKVRINSPENHISMYYSHGTCCKLIPKCHSDFLKKVY